MKLEKLDEVIEKIFHLYDELRGRLSEDLIHVLVLELFRLELLRDLEGKNVSEQP